MNIRVGGRRRPPTEPAELSLGWCWLRESGDETEGIEKNALSPKNISENRLKWLTIQMGGVSFVVVT